MLKEILNTFWLEMISKGEAKTIEAWVRMQTDDGSSLHFLNEILLLGSVCFVSAGGCTVNIAGIKAQPNKRDQTAEAIQIIIKRLVCGVYAGTVDQK